MLPPFIIEQIRKRETEALRRRAEDERRPRLEIPEPPRRRRPIEIDEEDEKDRGVVIVDLG